MSRSLLAILLVLTAAVPFLPAAPVPTHLFPKDQLYFPTQVGAEWVYDDEGYKYKFVVTQVEEKDSATLVTVGVYQPDGKTTQHAYTVEVSKSGIRETLNGNRKIDRDSTVIHELAHVIDVALVPAELRDELAAALPPIGSCTTAIVNLTPWTRARVAAKWFLASSLIANTAACARPICSRSRKSESIPDAPYTRHDGSSSATSNGCSAGMVRLGSRLNVAVRTSGSVR